MKESRIKEQKEITHEILLANIKFLAIVFKLKLLLFRNLDVRGSVHRDYFAMKWKEAKSVPFDET
jgi:hypothetical protein